MGMNGRIVLFPTAGKPPANLDATARKAIGLFEHLGLLLPGTADVCETPSPWLGRFTDPKDYKRAFPRKDYALYVVKPDRILPSMAEIVHLLDVDGRQVTKRRTIGLPYIDFSVIKKKLPVTCAYDGKELGKTWATIEFSYEDLRYDPEIHRILDPKHAIFGALEEAFSSPVTWAVDIC